MNYRDTKVKIKRIKVNIVKDGKQDLIVPLDDILNTQAKVSFTAGINTVLAFIHEATVNNIPVTPETIKAKYEEWTK